MTVLQPCPHPIARLVPQAPPMILLDEVVGWHSTGLTAALTLREDGIFFEPGQGVAAHVAIEWMAQACAAFVGLQAVDGGQPVRIGFLLGTRGFSATLDWFIAGQRPLVEVQQSFLDEEMAVFDCSVRLDDAVVAQAALTVYQPKDLQSVLAQQRVTMAGHKS